jgi:hypothetical protein
MPYFFDSKHDYMVSLPDPEIQEVGTLITITGPNRPQTAYLLTVGDEDGEMRKAWTLVD